jgi:hypothetical protein
LAEQRRVYAGGRRTGVANIINQESDLRVIAEAIVLTTIARVGHAASDRRRQGQQGIRRTEAVNIATRRGLVGLN